MKYKINEGFISQKIGKKITIFDADKSILYSLNETSSFIFDKLKKGLTEKQILDSLLSNYLVKENDVKIDLKRNIQDLLKRGILIR